MKARLAHLWDYLSSTYWFVPATMVALAGILAFGLLWIDRQWNAPVTSDWIYTGGADGARALLSTVAGSVITVAGVVFSITIATLTQASSQFGPRLLRNFMRDMGNQIVLGTFVATFFYCLLVLRSIRGGNDASFVPNISVTAAVVLAVGSLAVLIYFIDHISRALQGPQVVAAVGIELERAVCRPFPSGVGVEVHEPAASPNPLPDTAGMVAVTAVGNGYLQAIDDDSLLELAKCHDLLIELLCRPGDYIIKGSPLLRVVNSGSLDRAERASLARFFFLGRQRTAEQDVEYSVRQLVEIGVRALSPAINDPFTAINCIDWLSAAIASVARHGMPSRYRYDSDRHLRIIARGFTFAGLVNAAFNQIRQYGAGSVAVSLRLLEALASTAPQLKTDEHRAVLRRHVEMVYQQSRQRFDEQCDLPDLESRYHAAVAALRQP